MVDFGMYPCVLALNRFFDALPPCHFQSDHLDLWSRVACHIITPFFLELCPCGSDACCCCLRHWCHGVYLCWLIWSSEWAPKNLCLHTGMCAKSFMFQRSLDGIVLPHLNLVPSSSYSFYSSTKTQFQWHTESFVFYVNAEFQGMMCAQNCVLCSTYVRQAFHNCHISWFLQYSEFRV